MNELLAAAKAVIDEWDYYGTVYWEKIKTLRTAVERAEQEPEPEPVAWITPKGSLSRHACFMDCAPLYRHPPRQTGLDQLLERIRFLEQQIAEKKNA